MIGIIDVRGTTAKSGDLALLDAHLQQLVGQPFLFFRFSYGDELRLHLGRSRPMDHPKLRHLLEGAFVLGARASCWRIVSSSGVVAVAADAPPAAFRPVAPADLEATSLLAVGAQVSAARASAVESGIGLNLWFSDGTAFMLWPAPPEPDAPPWEDDVADWELFTPFDRWLRAGPGPHWAYLPSRAEPAPAPG